MVCALIRSADSLLLGDKCVLFILPLPRGNERARPRSSMRLRPRRSARISSSTVDSAGFDVGRGTPIVNGFCKQVFREVPMEFAVEVQKLLGVSLEGSVG